jgi:hypothetical protein
MVLMRTKRKMMKYKLYIITFVSIFFLPINDIIAQKNNSGFVPMTAEQRNKLLKNFTNKEQQSIATIESSLEMIKMQYFPSNSYILESSWEDFESLPRFSFIIGSLYPILESKDGEFVALFDIPDHLIKSVSNGKISVKQINEYHFILMRCMLFLSRGYTYPKMWRRISGISWKNIKRAVHYQPTNYLDNNFNADTLITCKIRLKPRERFRGKYKYCEGLIFTKTNVGCAAFYCFYTKKGYKKRDEYIREIGQMFRYK